MKVKIVLAVAVAGLMVASAVPGFAGMNKKSCGDKGYGQGPGACFPMSEKLDLTEKQQSELKEHREKFSKQREEVGAKIKEKEFLLGEELRNEPVNKQKVDALVDEIAGLKKSLIQNRVDSMLSFKAVLTAEQKKKLDEMMPFGKAIKSDLGLTDEQYEKVKAVLKEHHSCRMGAMKECAKGDSCSMKEQRKKMDSRMCELDAELDAKLEKLLTPEQMKKWKSMQAERQKDMKKNMKKGMKGGMGKECPANDMWMGDGE